MDFRASMKSHKVKFLLGTLVVLGVLAGLGFMAVASSVDYTVYSDVTYLSPSAITLQGNTGYVADETMQKVYKIDVATDRKTAEYDAGKAVNAVVVDGNSVYALTGGLDGELVKLNTDLAVQNRVETGHTPVDAMVVGDKLYVANRFDSSITVYNAATLQQVKEIAVSREPMAMTLAGTDLYVASHLPDDAANDAEDVSADVVVIDTKTNTLKKTIALVNGSGGVKDIVASEDGQYVYVSNLIARYAYPTSQLDRGWINTNAISIIQTKDASLLTAVLLDDVDNGASNPWGLQMDGDTLVATISGTREVVTINTAAMLERIAAVGKTYTEIDSVEDVPDYLPFLDGIKTRTKLQGEGARTLAVNNGKAYICNYFTGDIEIFDVDAKETIGSISLGTQPEANAVRRGEALWFDGTKCYQNWESCASCHPDARTDGFNWDNLNDGLGNPKQAASMLYSHRTPPVMITGARVSAELAVQKGMQFIQFNTMEQAQLNDINEYMKSLTPVQSPFLNRDGSLTADAEAGKVLFEEQGCTECHPAPLYTDLKMHQSAIPADERDSWDTRDFATPSLVEIWRTAPYFFDGRFTTLREAVEASLQEGHGLTDKQIDQLTAFVGSIGNQDEYYGVEQVRADSTDKINVLVPGTTVDSVTIRKQLETDKAAQVTMTLCKADGTAIQSAKTVTLDADMGVGDVATLNESIQVPSNLPDGAYLQIEIVDADDPTEALATPIRITK